MQTRWLHQTFLLKAIEQIDQLSCEYLDYFNRPLTVFSMNFDAFKTVFRDVFSVEELDFILTMRRMYALSNSGISFTTGRLQIITLNFTIMKTYLATAERIVSTSSGFIVEPAPDLQARTRRAPVNYTPEEESIPKRRNVDDPERNSLPEASFENEEQVSAFKKIVEKIKDMLANSSGNMQLQVFNLRSAGLSEEEIAACTLFFETFQNRWRNFQRNLGVEQNYFDTDIAVNDRSLSFRFEDSARSVAYLNYFLCSNELGFLRLQNAKLLDAQKTLGKETVLRLRLRLSSVARASDANTLAGFISPRIRRRVPDLTLAESMSPSTRGEPNATTYADAVPAVRRYSRLQIEAHSAVLNRSEARLKLETALKEAADGHVPDVLLEDQPAIVEALNNFVKAQFENNLLLTCTICFERCWRDNRRANNELDYICNKCNSDKGRCLGQDGSIHYIFSHNNDMNPMYHEDPDAINAYKHLLINHKLNEVEEMLISQHCPIMRVYRLKGGHSVGFSGNVINITQKIDTLITILPRQLSKLNVFKIRRKTGMGDEDYKDFRIRRERVRLWLQFLQRWNPHYRNITISDNNLNELPENGNIGESIKDLLPENTVHLTPEAVEFVKDDDGNDNDNDDDYDDEDDDEKGGVEDGPLEAETDENGDCVLESGVDGLPCDDADKDDIELILDHILESTPAGDNVDNLTVEPVAWPQHGSQPLCEYTTADLLAK
jgi:hypothetical protein